MSLIRDVPLEERLLELVKRSALAALDRYGPHAAYVTFVSSCNEYPEIHVYALRFVRRNCDTAEEMRAAIESVQVDPPFQPPSVAEIYLDEVNEGRRKRRNQPRWVRRSRR